MLAAYNNMVLLILCLSNCGIAIGVCLYSNDYVSILQAKPHPSEELLVLISSKCVQLAQKEAIEDGLL